MAPHHISSSASTGVHNITYDFEITQMYNDSSTNNLLLGLTLRVNNTRKRQVKNYFKIHNCFRSIKNCSNDGLGFFFWGGLCLNTNVIINKIQFKYQLSLKHIRLRTVYL